MVSRWLNGHFSCSSLCIDSNHHSAGSRQRGQVKFTVVKTQEAVRDTDALKPMETDGNERATALKKQQPSAPAR